ncbi:CKLF-like MARVEL transmembrane domain-containing protein 1 isoform X3 [Ailuropoda melanoleuca]|uniref:CKLF-like MARVEL transmembrane domain-containing protein 1 isoform X3 n=1 Tax=Ailuropoda melanoleuca TaxID=9646 RepID=UPI00059B1669|nr:CKLF-like MARVEL transmembrane domain-containing protein 1 isoform X3 [Ailuropoda melanoleuca]XP_019654391.1 CKLF-like MARVEL transmembrane domain-containing protein 1 isoform X3 [Ailuropoda melanoleuca]XP_034494671.1 CKLF-like MARVEL transmembrane domain-containing protein 1 isoform X3 [Ailuropoda melanoleuca]
MESHKDKEVSEGKQKSLSAEIFKRGSALYRLEGPPTHWRPPAYTAPLSCQDGLVPPRQSIRDLVNSFISAVFLLIVAILAMQEMERRHLFYVGGTQCLTAAIVCILDAVMVTKKMRDKMRRILGLDF